MSKQQKTFDRWKKNTPTTAKRRDVEGVLELYFPGEYTLDGGSHIVVDSEKLKPLKDIAPYGILTIPLKSGRHVGRVYLKTLIKVIEGIQKMEEEVWGK